MKNHLHDVKNNISNTSISSMSSGNLANFIRCIYEGCLVTPIARCIICSKYYCYLHLQTCFQIHPNDIEIIRPLQNPRNS